MRVGHPVSTIISRVTIDADKAMGGYKFTGLGAGSASGHSLRYEQVIDVYLPLAGGTLTGDLNIGGNKLKTTASLLYEKYSTQFHFRNLADTAFVDIYAQGLKPSGTVSIVTSGQGIDAPNADDAFAVFKARDNTQGRVEIARLQGAADAYFQATLPMVLNPSAEPGTPVEGHFWYDATPNALRYRDNSATRKVGRIATGTYSGTDASDRQITTGFKCACVILMCETTNVGFWVATPDGTVRQIGATTAISTDLLLHATDGFVVDEHEANDSALDPYNYIAFEET